MQRITVKRTSGLLLLYGIVVLQQSNVIAEISFVDLKGSSLLLDGYEAHNQFMNSVELTIGQKLKNTLTYALQYCDSDAGSFLSDIGTLDYSFLQFFQAILTSDITFANFLFDIFTPESGEFSNWLMTNVNLPKEHVYKVVKSLSDRSKIGLSPLPSILMKGIILLNTKYNYFQYACSRGDLTTVDWAIEAGIPLDRVGLEGLEAAWEGKNWNIVKVLVGNKAFPFTNITYFSKVVNEQSETLLHFAVETDNSEYVLSLLKAGAEINAIDFYGKSPLQRAIEVFNTPIVSLLLSNGADMNHGTESADSMLHVAAKIGNYETANLLIKEDFQIDRENGEGLTAFNVLERVGISVIINELLARCNFTESKEAVKELYEMPFKFNNEFICLSISKNRATNKDWDKLFLRNLTNVAIKLLKKGAQSDLKYEDKYKLQIMAIDNKLSEAVRFLLKTGIKEMDISRSLHRAVLTDDIETMKLLIDAGADFTLANTRGWKPIHVAASNGNLKSVKFLLDKGDDVNSKSSRNETALQIAVVADQSDIVNLLIENGANIKTPDSDGWQTIHIATLRGRTHIIQILLAKGANPNARDILSKTPLFHASIQGFVSISKILLDNGATVNARDSSGRTALHFAIWGGNTEVVSLLLSRGANIDARDDENKTALYEATMEGRKDLVLLLIQRGADVDISDDIGWTPLHAASQHGFTEIILLLTKNGANVNAKSKRGETPLYRAALQGKYYAVYTLIRAGANVNAANIRGETPLQAARSAAAETVVNLLEEHGAF